jgi:hypothetical protein
MDEAVTEPSPMAKSPRRRSAATATIAATARTAATAATDRSDRGTAPIVT